MYCILLRGSVSVVYRIVPDRPSVGLGHLTQQRFLAASPYDDLRQSATVLVPAFHHTIEIVGYLEDSTDFGQKPVSVTWFYSTVLSVFPKLSAHVLENLKCDDVSHFSLGIWQNTLMYNSYF